MKIIGRFGEVNRYRRANTRAQEARAQIHLRLLDCDGQGNKMA